MSPPPITKKVDPGWNDPPILNYNASNPPPRSRITNKRVAFPLSSNQTSSLSQTNSPIAAPIPTTTPSLLLPSSNMVKPKTEISTQDGHPPLSLSQTNPSLPALIPNVIHSLDVDKFKSETDTEKEEDPLKEILSNVTTVLKTMGDSDGIQDKIDIFRSMWEENKFSSKLQKYVLDMTRHIVEGDTEKANECQLQLMMEDASLCERWIVGFRQLISDENSAK